MKGIFDIPDNEYFYIKYSDKNVFAEAASKECMLNAIKNSIPYDKDTSYQTGYTDGYNTAQQKYTRSYGKWIRIDEEKVKCPICEVIHLMYAYPRTTANFCPTCGAKLGMGEQK